MNRNNKTTQITLTKSYNFALKSLLLLAVLLTAYDCKHDNKNNTETQSKLCIPDSMSKSITFDTIKLVSTAIDLNLSGKIAVDEDKQVKIYPLASGWIQEVKVELGDYVQQGQLLALIKSPDIAELMDNAITAKKDMEIAKKNMDAQEQLYKSGLASEVDYVTSQKNYDKAFATYTKANEIIKLYGSKEGDISSYYIKSPISGFITEKKISTGMQIRSDAGDNLFAISDLQDVWVIANVYETDIGKITLGDTVNVNTISYNDKIFLGKIDKIYNVLNPDTKVLNIRIKLNNPNYLLKPGMFARINVRCPGNEEVLAISSKAIIFDNNKNYLLKYDGKCNLNIQPITVIKSFEEKSFIKGKGIKKGDIIIEKNNFYLFTALNLL